MKTKPSRGARGNGDRREAALSTTHSKSNTLLRFSCPRVQILLVLGLIAVTFAAHSPAIWADYIWDDDSQLYQNQFILLPGGLYKLWFSTQPMDYWPLTSTTFWIEWRIWGNHPAPYHVTNIALHALASVLLWRVLKRLGLNDLGAFLGGLLFAVHPITVTSTAWIAERKNVLSMTLYLLAILFYLTFEETGRQKWYMLALLSGTAALLAKTSIVALPAILFLLTWWRQSAITKHDLVRTIPFFLLSLTLGLVTLWFQHHHAISGAVVRPEGLASRIASVGWVVWFYLYKTILPINLAMVYPRWDIDSKSILAYAPLLLLLVCLGILWHYHKTWGRGPLAAMASFVIVLAPVLGLLDMAYAHYSLVADHLLYPGLPGMMALIGGVLAAIYAWAQRENHHIPPAIVATAIGFVVLLSAVLTWRQARVFRDSESLWTHNLQLDARSWAAHLYLGNTYRKKGDINAAMNHYNMALEIKPGYAEAYNNRGSAYEQSGNSDRAIEDYTKAISLRPNYAMAYCNRGISYGRKGNYAQAIRDCSQAIEFKPDYTKAYDYRSMAYTEQRDYAQAIKDLTKVIELEPNNMTAYTRRGLAYLATRNFDLAIRDCTKAIALVPNYAPAYQARGTAYAQTSRQRLAIDDFSRLIHLQPNNTDALNNRAAAFFLLRNYDLAWADLNRCRQLGGTPNPALIADLIKASGKMQ